MANKSNERVSQQLYIYIKFSELKTVIECLEDSEPETRASAALALGGLAKNEQIAGLLVQSGTLAALTQILASPELPLKQAAAFALGNIAKHSEVFAEHIADCNVIPLLVKAIHNDHVRLKADGFLCLANIARHSPGLATEVAESGLNEAIEHLSCQPGIVQKQAATLVRDICRHNLRLSNMVVMSNGLGSLVNLVQCGNDCSVLPAVMALGYMSAQSEQVAEQIIDLDAVHSLQCTLDCEGKEQLQAAAAWTLGQIGKHSVDNVKALTVENVLSTLVQKIGSPHVSENLKTKCRSALRLLLPKCEDTKDLENILMGDIPEALIAPILSAFSKILPCYPETKVTFVTSGCLRKIQELEPDQETAKYIQTIQDSFPPEVVQFVSPSYLESLIKTLDTFVPENISNMPLCQDLTNLASLESVKSVSDSVKSDILPNDSNES